LQDYSIATATEILCKAASVIALLESAEITSETI
jgi:hypothetical protein